MNDWNRIGAPRPTSRSQLPQQHPGQHPQHSPQHPMHANATQQQYSSSGTSSYIAAQASMPQVVHAQYEQLQLSQNLSPHPPISIPRPHPPPKVFQKRHSLTPPSSNVNIIIAPLDFATRSVSPPLRPDSFAELQAHQQQQEQERQQEQQRLQQRMGLHVRRSEDQDRLQEQGRQFAQMQQHQLHEQQRHIAHQHRLQQQHQQLAHQQQLQKQEQKRQLAEQLQLQEERRRLAEQQKLQKEEQERQLAQQLQIQEKRRQFKREKEEQERQIAQQLQMQELKRQKEEQERQLAQQIKMQEEQRQFKARKEEEERRIARQLQMQEQQQLYAEEQGRHDEELERQQLQLQEERRQLAPERKRQKEEQARQRALQQKRQKEEEAHQLALQQKRGKDEQRLLAQQKPRQNNSHQSTPFVRPGTTTQIVQPSSAATRRDSSTSAAGQQNTGGRSSSTNNNTHPPASSPGPSQYFAEPMHPVGGWIYESTAPQKSLAPGPSSAGASVRPSHLVKTRAIAVTKSPTAREASSSATPSTGAFSYPQTGVKPSPDQLPPPTTVPASVQTRVVVGPKPSFSRIPSATTGSVSAGPSHRPPISIPPPAPAQIPSTIVPVAVGPSHQQELPAPAPVTPLAPVVAPVQIPMLPALTKEEEAFLVKEAENFKKGIETIAKEYHRIWPYPPAGFQVSTMMLQRMRAIMALDPELPKPFIAKALGISLIHFNLWLKGMLKRGVHQGVQEKIERLVGNFIARKYFSIRAFQARKIRRTQEWTHSEKNRRNNSRGRPPAVTKELAAIYNGTEIQIGNNNTRIVHTRPVTSVAANNNAGGAGQKGAATKNTGGVVAAKKGAVVPAIPVRTALYNGITNPKLTEKQKVVFPFWARNAIKQNDIKNYAKAKPEVSSQYLHNHVQVRNEPPHIRRIENHAFSYYVHKPPPTPVVIVPKKKNNNTGATSKKNKKNTKSANTSTATKSPKPRRARPGKPRASVELTAAAHRPRRSSRHQDETAKKKISNNDNTGPSTIIKNVESVKPQTSAKKVIPSVERESEKEKIEKDAGGSSSYTDVAQSGIAAYAAKAAELNRIARTRHSNPSKDGGVAKTNSTPTKNDPQHSNPNSNSASEKQQASKDAGVPTNNSTPTKNKTPEKGAPAISTDDAVSCPPTPFVDDREGSPAEENNSMSGTKAAWSWIKNISSAIRNSNVVTPQEKDNNTPAKRPIEKAENEEEKEEDGRALNKKPRLE